MSKKIAIITGATGGLGRKFTEHLTSEEVDEIWAIARNEAKLEKLRYDFGKKIITISKDLSDNKSLDDIAEMLAEQKPEVKFLINNAGMGKMGSYKDFSITEIEKTIDINCKAAAVMCSICIPYMKNGDIIMNIASQASFQPDPYLNMYAATKAFLRSYSRALNVELEGTGITVTAVCPGWVDTEMLSKEINGQKVEFPGLVSAERVVEQAFKDAKKGRDMSVCTMHVKCQHVMAKIFPQKAVMKTWVRIIRRYVQK